MISFIEKPILTDELLRISEKDSIFDHDRRFALSLISEFACDRNFNTLGHEKTEILIDLLNRHGVS